MDNTAEKQKADDDLLKTIKRSPTIKVEASWIRSAPSKRSRKEESEFDAGIKHEVEVLRSNGIETFESCQGGSGHAYPVPTVRFHGDRTEGLRALAVAITFRLPVAELRRVWPILDGEPTGPWWELTFLAPAMVENERKVN